MSLPAGARKCALPSSATGTVPALSTTYGYPSSPAAFAISGTSLLAGITVTAPEGYEVSTSSTSGYAASVTVGSAGTVPGTSVYVRIAALTPAGAHAGTLTVSSRGASTRIVPMDAGTVAAANLGMVTFTAPTSLAADGTAKTFSAASPGVTTFTYVYTGRGGTIYGPTSYAPATPGLYTVTATPDGNYTGSAQLDFEILGPPALQMHLVGQAVYDSASGTTRVTHLFVGTPNGSLIFEYTEHPSAPFRDCATGGYAPVIQSDATGIFQLSINEPGDKATLWNSKMFVRARRP